MKQPIITGIYEFYQKLVEPHVSKKFSKGGKALRILIDEFVNALLKGNVETEEYYTILKDYESDLILSKDALKKDGYLFDSINPKYHRLAKILYECCPRGVGSPRAATGEGEFMALMLSPRITLSKKKNMGDLIDAGETIEMKGKDIAITGRISGKEFAEIGLKVSEKYGIKCTKCKHDGKLLDAWEPWNDKTKKKHTISEFKRVGKKTSISALFEYMDLAKIPISMKKIEGCFDNDLFVVERFIVEFVKALFSSDENRGYDYLTIIDDDFKVRCIGPDTNIRKIHEMIDNGDIQIGGSYLRMHYNVTIGWYFSLR